jgi:Spy/CpxP family protein refolding chaperone
MKRFFLYIMAVAIGVVLFAAVANAQPQGRMMQRERGAGFGMRLGEELGLTDEQKDQIHQIFLDARKKNIDTNAKQELARIELHELMTADTPDQKKIDAKVAELSQLHAARMSSHIASVLAVQKLLTPEQRNKAKELRLFERFGHRGFGGGMMHGGPGGGFRRHMQMRDDVDDDGDEL